MWDKITGDIVVSNYIPKELVNLIYNTEQKYKAYNVIHTDGAAYYDVHRHTDEFLDACGLDNYFRAIIKNKCMPIDNYSDYVLSSDKIETFCLFFRSDDDRAAAKKLFLETGRLSVASSALTNLEVYSTLAGKGNALLCLADMVGADRMQTISIGDSDNDMSMIQKAGLGLATSNACDSLKQEADEIICSNEENVICFVASHYFK